MDNKTHIQQGRSAAMENYVDFSGEKKSLSGSKLNTLSKEDKTKYLIYGASSIVVAYLLYKKYKK
jgi:hypothetical protein